MGDRTNHVSRALTGMKEGRVSEVANRRRGVYQRLPIVHDLGACGAVKLRAQFKMYTFCFEIPLRVDLTLYVRTLSPVGNKLL